MKYIGVTLQLVGLLPVSLDFFDIYKNKYFPVVGYTLIFLGLVITLYNKTKTK